MKSHTRLIPLVLTIIIIAASLSTPISAEIKPLFDDVLPSQWFYSDVLALTRSEIISGYPDGSFRPHNNISCAEFLKLIVTASKLEIIQSSTGHWNKPYIDSAIKSNILNTEEIENGVFSADTPVTRSYMARLMVRALGIDLCKVDNPFTDEADEYVLTASNEYLLYGYSDADGYRFNGGGNATRAEVAAVINRMIAYRDDSDTYKHNAVMELSLITNEAQCVDLLYYAHRDIVEALTFRSTLDIETLRDCYDIMYGLYPEAVYIDKFGVEYYNPLDGITEYTIEFDYGDNRTALIDMRDKSDEGADSAVGECIGDNMTDATKIKAIHDYIILDCAYDYDNYLADTIPDESYRAFGVFVEHTAVCQGYSAAFNLMAARVGLKSIAVVGTLPGGTPDGHMWNAVYTDGEIYFIDVSADDPAPDEAGRITYDNYMMSKSEFEELGYKWDNETVSIKYFY